MHQIQFWRLAYVNLKTNKSQSIATNILHFVFTVYYRSTYWTKRCFSGIIWDLFMIVCCCDSEQDFMARELSHNTLFLELKGKCGACVLAKAEPTPTPLLRLFTPLACVSC